MQKLQMMSKDRVQANIEKIQKLFPNAVTEVVRDGKTTLAVDFDVLKQEMSDILVNDKEQRYQFTWPDKFKAQQLANKRITSTLRPCKEESVNFDTTQNLYIEGDNLDVLKLLQETYLGKIKMIYIDPPYNTGNDFVYKDNFAMGTDEYLENSDQFDDEGNRLVQNTESNGRFHTDWLNMIYPRLKIARDLLSDDGVIFISIDHHEVLNLSKIANEIFGFENRIGIISVINNLKGRSDDKFFATCNEFLLVYAKNRCILNIGGFDLDEEELENDYDRQDEIGFYKLIGFRKTGNAWKREERPFMFYPVLFKDNAFSTVDDNEFKLIYNVKTSAFDDSYITELTKEYTKLGYCVIWPKAEDGTWGRWRWGRKTFHEQKDYNLELNMSGTLCTKMRANLEDGSIRVKSAKTLWYKPEYETGSASKLLKLLFANDSLFDNPKSLVYIKDIIKIATSPNNIILDFFSGSATTAHAVMQLNAEDGGNRKFIMVQLPEVCNEKSEAFKAGYNNICEIGKERIRRAGKKILQEQAHLVNSAQSGALAKGEAVAEFLTSQSSQAVQEQIKSKLDVGFRVLKLDSSNMKDVYYRSQEYQQDMLDDMADNVKEDRTSLDLLFQVMLEFGVSLSAKIEEKQICGKRVFFVDGNSLVACFDSNVSDEVVKAIAKTKPSHAVLRDSSLANDSVATNFAQIFATYSPNTTRRVI